MKIKLLWIILLLIPSTLALDECGFSVPTTNACSIVTPITSCPTIDIFYSNGTLLVDDGTLSDIGTSSMKNHTIKFTTADTYSVNLCNEASRSIIALDIDAIVPSASWWSYLLQIYYQTLPGAW